MNADADELDAQAEEIKVRLGKTISNLQTLQLTFDCNNKIETTCLVLNNFAEP